MSNLIIEGNMGKGGGGKESKDSLVSTQLVKTLFVVSEGVIDSVENVFLDTMPIDNFDSEWEYRTGLPSQPIINNFITNEAPLGGFNSLLLTRGSTAAAGKETPNIEVGSVMNSTAITSGLYYKIRTITDATSFTFLGADSTPAVGEIFKAKYNGTSISSAGTCIQVLGFKPDEFSTNIPADVTKIRLGFNTQVMSYMDGDGNLKGSSAYFLLYSRPSTSATWTLEGQFGIKGKTTHGYSFDVNLDAPAGVSSSSPWQIKIIRDTPDSGSSKKQNSVTWNSVTLLYPHSSTYPNSALVGIQLNDATQFGNRVPEIMFKVKGRKVKVFSNYDSVNKTYTGNWDGNFALATYWTSNPALILLDLLTDYRAGLGIDISDVDKYSFYNLAKYCDEQIITGYTGAVYANDEINKQSQLIQEAFPNYISRYTFDYSFQQRDGIKDVLAQVLSVCNANLITNEFGQVGVVYSHPNQVVKRNVTNANVVDGAFTYQSSGIEQRTNLVNVTYNNKLNFGRTETATVSDDSLITRYGLQPLDVVLPGCYYEAQAIRKARHVLYTNCYFTNIISFAVFLDGLTYKIGDLIRVYDNYNQDSQQAGVITAVTNPNNTTVLTLDRTIHLAANVVYTFYCYDTSGNEITKTISTNTVGGSDISEMMLPAVYSVNLNSIFVFSGSIAGKIYKVISIDKSEESIYSVSALEHSEDIFSYVNGDISLTPKTGDFNDVTKFYTTPVESISVQQNFGTNGIYSQGRLQVSWVWGAANPQSYKANFKLSYSVDDGNPVNVDVVSSDTFDILNPIPGVYSITLWAINPYSGIYSTALTSNYEFRVAATQSTLQPPINLRITGTAAVSPQPATLTFATPALSLSWDYNPANQNVTDAVYDYLVVIYDSTGLIKVKEYSTNLILGAATTDPLDAEATYTPLNGSFELSFNENVNIFGGTPTRTFKVAIHSRDTIGDVSAPITVTVTNPVPALTSMTVTPGVSNVVANITASSEIDSKEYLIYRGADANFVANTASQVYKGTSNRVVLPTPDNNTYYYKYSISDNFGSDGLNVSAAVTGASTSTTVDRYTYTGLQFSTDEATNTVSWTQFTALKDNGTSVVVNSGSTNWTSGVIYLYYDGTSTLKNTTSSSTAVAGRILATYTGGNNVTADAGKAFIDGDQIIAGSLLANALATNTIYIASFAQIGDILQSSNFNANTGWSIKKDGTAVFRQITISGGAIDSNSTLGGTTVTQVKSDISTAASTSTWNGTSGKPSNIAALTGTEAIQNGLISLINGNISGIGSGNGTAVANSAITITNGVLTGVGTPNIVVDNSKVTAASIGAADSAATVTALATKLVNNAANTLSGGAAIIAGPLVLNSDGSYNSRYGVAISSKGLVGYNTSGLPTFSIDTNGTAVFAGSLNAATGSFAGSISAATGNFTGSVTIGSAPAVSGTTMTGSGAVLNSGGTFAIGNSNGNVSFNGTTLTLNGTIVANGNLTTNAVTTAKVTASSITEVTTYSSSNTLTSPGATAGANSSTTIFSSLIVPSVDISTERLLFLSVKITHADTTPGTFSISIGGSTPVASDVATRLVDGANNTTYGFIVRLTTAANTTNLGALSINLVNAASTNFWNTGSVSSQVTVSILTGKR